MEFVRLSRRTMHPLPKRTESPLSAFEWDDRVTAAFCAVSRNRLTPTRFSVTAPHTLSELVSPLPNRVHPAIPPELSTDDLQPSIRLG